MKNNLDNKGISQIIVITLAVILLLISFGLFYRFSNLFTEENKVEVPANSPEIVNSVEPTIATSEVVTYNPQGTVSFLTSAWQYPSFDQVIQMKISNANQDFIDTFNINGILIESMDGKKYKLNLKINNDEELTVNIRMNLKTTKSLQFVDLKPEITYQESDPDLSKHFWKINENKDGLERGPAIEQAIKSKEPVGSAKFIALAWKYPSYDHPIDLVISGNNEFRDIFNKKGLLITYKDGNKKMLNLKLDDSGNLNTQIVLNLKTMKSIEFVDLNPEIIYLESSSFNYWVVNKDSSGLIRGPGSID